MMPGERAAAEPRFALKASPGFVERLAELRGSLALTTYQAGKLIFLSAADDGAINLFERDVTRAMGMAVFDGGRSFTLATQHQIYRYDNILRPNEVDQRGFDAVYAPHVSWFTGSVDAHDVAIGDADRPVFVNTLYSCIAAVSDSHSFRPLWRPSFVSALVPEDRCHLNGLAMEYGQLRFATAAAATDSKDGWREHRSSGGVLLDIESGETIVAGLSMPHSPRLHGGKLWLLNSGAGEFGYVDLKAGRFEPVAFCQGYARGLAFAGDMAIIGLSQPRNATFAGLPLDALLEARKAKPICGLAMIDLASGELVAWARIEGEVKELFEVAILPGVHRASLIGFKTDEIKQVVSIAA